MLVQPPAALVRDAAGLQRYLTEVAGTGVPMLMVQDLEWNGPGIPVEAIRAFFEEVEAFRCRH